MFYYITTPETILKNIITGRSKYSIDQAFLAGLQANFDLIFCVRIFKNLAGIE